MLGDFQIRISVPLKVGLPKTAFARYINCLEHVGYFSLNALLYPFLDCLLVRLVFLSLVLLNCNLISLFPVIYTFFFRSHEETELNWLSLWRRAFFKTFLTVFIFQLTFLFFHSSFFLDQFNFKVHVNVK